MATSLTLQNDPTLPQGYLKVNGTTAVTITENGISTPQATIGSINGILKSTNGLVSDSGGFIYVPLNDPTDPSNNNSGVRGTSVINFAATGNTSATPYTGATQTANLASIVPNDAYMVLVRLRTSNNTNESNNLVSAVTVYIKKNASDVWGTGIYAETLSTTIEANEVDTFPLIFDRGTKTFQSYLYHTKATGVTFSTAPSYSFSVEVLGYYIK
jgi:hypothetical protein